MNPYSLLLNWNKYFNIMDPFEYLFQVNKWWIETLFEVRSLRNCHNINAYRLDRIEQKLIDEGR
jgi:hypothetical protein